MTLIGFSISLLIPKSCLVQQVISTVWLIDIRGEVINDVLFIKFIISELLVLSFNEEFIFMRFEIPAA